MSERLALRVPETAEAIGISRAKTYELIAKGVIPSIRVGSSIRVPVEALRQWIRDQQQASERG
jgi:excisionase family DNA binding protein